jgi:hypothetical protein
MKPDQMPTSYQLTTYSLLSDPASLDHYGSRDSHRSNHLLPLNDLDIRGAKDHKAEAFRGCL